MVSVESMTAFDSLNSRCMSFQLASKANPRSMSSGIATVINDQTSQSFKVFWARLLLCLASTRTRTMNTQWCFLHGCTNAIKCIHTALGSAPRQGSRRWSWPKTCCGRSWVKLLNILGWVHLDSFMAYFQMQAECSLLHGAAPGASLSWPVSMSSSFAWRYVICGRGLNLDLEDHSVNPSIHQSINLLVRLDKCRLIHGRCTLHISSASGATSMKKPLAVETAGDSPNLPKSSLSSSSSTTT